MATIMYNIYIEHMKHEYTVETIIQFAVETGTGRPHPNLGGQWTHKNISHKNLCYMQILCKETVILCEHRVTNIHIHL